MTKEFKSLSEKEYKMFNENGFKTRDVKKFIEEVGRIIIVRQSRRLQLIKLKKLAGKDLI